MQSARSVIPVFRSYNCVNYAQRRFRVKTKWAFSKKQKSSCHLALEHFDKYYSSLYGKRWPLIRASLLSPHKYCALLNNFGNKEDVIVELQEHGCVDFIDQARAVWASRTLEGDSPPPSSSEVSVDQPKPKNESLVSEDGTMSLSDRTNLYDFMPVTDVVTKNEDLDSLEVEQNIYDNSSAEVPIIKESTNTLHIPHHLQAMSHVRGFTDYFRSPRKLGDSGKFDYFLMDPSSILPVLALDLEPGCSVLDLCAAPGAKTLAMLQTLLPGDITCVDHSYNRLGRLKDILKMYVPQSYTLEKHVIPVHCDGVTFCKNTKENQLYDRILVDVPCYTDRHVLHQDDNNIFRRSRISERLKIQEIQRALLYHAILCCRPGGCVVYSTCTLSLPQNDGTVQSVLEQLWRDTNIDVAVQVLSPLTDAFSDQFDFYPDCRHGQLVLPSLSANSGPMYFCKIKRIK